MHAKMRGNRDDASGSSLYSLLAESLFMIAEYTMNNAHTLFESEPLYRQFVPSSPPPPPLTPTSEASTNFSDTTSKASTASFDTTINTQPPSDISDSQDDAPTSNEFATAWHEHSLGVTGLLGLSLTSRRYRFIAQEVLYRSPLPRSDDPWHKSAPIFLLARTLLSSPRLARHVNMLQLDVPRKWSDEIVSSATTSSLVAQT
jgi:hypothetical protein